jgi:ubiquitin-protein ligase
MPETIATEKSLAEAVTKLVDSLHNKYQGIMIKPISNYEDEDFTFEITIPKNLPIDQVEETCHMECIRVEDEYDLFILPKVVY